MDVLTVTQPAISSSDLDGSAPTAALPSSPADDVDAAGAENLATFAHEDVGFFWAGAEETAGVSFWEEADTTSAEDEDGAASLSCFAADFPCLLFLLEEAVATGVVGEATIAGVEGVVCLGFAFSGAVSACCCWTWAGTTG